MKLNEAVSGALLCLLALFALLSSRDITVLPGQAYGPALVPRLLAGALFVCGLILMGKGMKRGGPLAVLAPWTRAPRSLAGAALVPASLLFYIVASERIGFVPAAIVILTGLLFYRRGALGTSFLIALSVSLLAHGLFAGVFRVPLPRGWLDPWIG